jgi:hypothetical protein
MNNLFHTRNVLVGLLLIPNIPIIIDTYQSFSIPLSIWCSIYVPTEDNDNNNTTTATIVITIVEIKPVIMYNDIVIDTIYDDLQIDNAVFTYTYDTSMHSNDNNENTKTAFFLLHHIGTIHITNMRIPTLKNSLYTLHCKITYTYIIPDSITDFTSGVFTNCKETETFYSTCINNEKNKIHYNSSTFKHIYDNIQYIKTIPYLTKELFLHTLSLRAIDDKSVSQKRSCSVGNIKIPYKNKYPSSLLQITIPLSIGFLYDNIIRIVPKEDMIIKINRVTFTMENTSTLISTLPNYIIEKKVIDLHVHLLNVDDSLYICHYIGNIQISNINVQNILYIMAICILNMNMILFYLPT